MKEKVLTIREVDNGYVVTMRVIKPETPKKGKGKTEVGMPMVAERYEEKELVCDKKPKLFKIVKSFFDTDIQVEDEDEDD